MADRLGAPLGNLIRAAERVRAGDFTARVDTQTEQKILANVRRDYPGITLLSVTQKIAAIEDYEQIILLMEGEIVASGTHAELMQTCPEYVQIYQSQRSTSHYEQPELQS